MKRFVGIIILFAVILYGIQIGNQIGPAKLISYSCTETTCQLSIENTLNSQIDIEINIVKESAPKRKVTETVRFDSNTKQRVIVSLPTRFPGEQVSKVYIEWGG